MSREICVETFDLAPRTNLTLRLDILHQDEAGQEMAAAVVRVLRAVAGDALLVLNGETPVARRRGGQGVLDEESWFWTAEALEQLGPGWRIGSDPGPTNL